MRQSVIFSGLALTCALLHAIHVTPKADPISEETCRPGHRALFYSPEKGLDQKIQVGFSDSLFHELAAPLGRIGYCLSPMPHTPMGNDSVLSPDSFVLNLLVSGSDPSLELPPDQVSPMELVVTLLRLEELTPERLHSSRHRPLASLFYSPEESRFHTILAKKIVENLRSQYVSHLLIESQPPGVSIRTDVGLEGLTPVEWILPVGNFTVEGRKPGHIPVRRSIDLSRPGSHTYFLQLKKRQFYHSNFIYPALLSGTVSLASYLLESHYYSQYQALGREDLERNPSAFSRTFNKAKQWERLAAGSLAFSGFFLGLSFVF